MFASWTIKKLAPHLVWVQDNCIFAGFVVLFPFLSAELKMTWLPEEKLRAKKQWKWILFSKIIAMKNSTSYRRILVKIRRQTSAFLACTFEQNYLHERFSWTQNMRQHLAHWEKLVAGLGIICVWAKEKKRCHENNERKELKGWQCFMWPLVST